ncbi:hypothetical protein LTR66_010052 [Elasticomyces elasticus]|nr:hypothetical protein LTR66_010052 [Elasticomyces elasticus]
MTAPNGSHASIPKSLQDMSSSSLQSVEKSLQKDVFPFSSKRTSENTRSSKETIVSEDSEHEPVQHDDRSLSPYTTAIRAQSQTRSAKRLDLSRTQTNASTTTSDPRFEIDFEEDDRANPRSWSLKIIGLVIASMSYATTCVVAYSTSYTSAIPGIITDFGVSKSIGILGVTTYLLGMAVGSVILAPLSEMYGRRPIYIIALGLFTLLLLPCALAPNVEAILVTRFFGAFAASAMVSNAPGTINDISSEEYRALAFSIWSIGPMNGPVIGPVIGGFVFQYLGWRWTIWVVMIMSGAAFFGVAVVPETYAPAILRARAAKKRKVTGDDRYWSRYDERLEFLPLLKVNLSRPFVMAVTEPIW